MSSLLNGGESSRERSTSAKRPSPVGEAEDRSKARRASPRPPGVSGGDADMLDAADIHIQSTPESRRSEGASHSGVSRRRGDSPARYSRSSNLSPILVSHDRGSGRGLPDRVEISTPPAVRSRSSRESEPGRDEQNADLQLLVERGEASGPVVATLIAFADQIRSLERQLGSMHESWCEEHEQLKNRVERLASDVGLQADAGRMRTVVQQFASEIIPDTRLIVRAAVDEQSVIIDERINSLATEMQNSVGRLENNTRTTHELIRDNHMIIHRSQAAFEDKTQTDIGEVERRIASLEARSSAGLAAVSSFARASDSGGDAAIASVSDRLDTVAHEGENFGVWATAKIKELEEEIKSLTSQVRGDVTSRGFLTSEVRFLRSEIASLGIGPTDQAAPPMQATVAPRNWQEMFNTLHRKVEEFADRVRAEARRNAQNQEHQATMDSRLNALTASSEGIGNGLRALRTQVRNVVANGAPGASTEQIQAVVRREMNFYRDQVDVCTRRLGAVRQSVQVLTDVSNTTQERIAGIENALEQNVADLVARGERATAPGPGFVAFVGQPHRVRSPTPNPSDQGGSRGGAAGGRTRGVSPLSNRSQGTITPSMSAGIRDDNRSGRRSVSPGRDDSVHRGYGQGREDERTRDRSFSPARHSRTHDEDRRARDRGADRTPQTTTATRARGSGGRPSETGRSQRESRADRNRAAAPIDREDPGGARTSEGHGRATGPAPAAAAGPGRGPGEMCSKDDPTDRRHPNARFSCVVCERRFCHPCMGDDGRCMDCHLLMMRCCTCWKSAQEVSMYQCHVCERNICDTHTFLGHDNLERCARCHGLYNQEERESGKGGPPSPSDGKGGGGGPPGSGGAGGKGSRRPPDEHGPYGGGKGHPGPSGGGDGAGGAPSGGTPEEDRLASLEPLLMPTVVVLLRMLPVSMDLCMVEG